MTKEVKPTQEVIQSKHFIYNPVENSNILETNNSYFKEQIKSLYTKTETEDGIDKKKKEEVGEEHPFDYATIEQLSKRFAIISSVADKICDYALGDGYNIYSENKKIVEALTLWRKNSKIDFFIRPWFNEGLLKGTSFLEIADFKLNNTGVIIKNPSANTIYVKKDDVGNIIGYTQYIDRGLSKSNEEEVVPLDTDSMVQLNINNISNNTYGMGIVYSALPIVENFLNAQKSMHKLLKRKANSPIHVKIGNAEKDDYPEQSEINTVGKSMQFMNDSTEYVTGPNVEMEVLDFGDVGDKFISVIDNDLKLLSYSFQVPEIILGATSGFVGSAEVQEKAFERNIKSYQEQMGYIMKREIFDKVLLEAGITDLDYEILWNSKTNQEKNDEIKIIKDLLGSSIILSSGMRKSLERQLAAIYDFNYDDIEKETEEEDEKIKKEEEEEREREQEREKELQPKPKDEEPIKPIDKKQVSKKPIDKKALGKEDENIKKFIDKKLSPQELELELELKLNKKPKEK